jgi:hypothetical protein
VAFSVGDFADLIGDAMVAESIGRPASSSSLFVVAFCAASWPQGLLEAA